MAARPGADPIALFHPAVQQWFTASFETPTAPQILGWPAIARGESTLVLAPTGSGKTLAAFLWCLDRLLFAPIPPASERCRVLYVSPLKALAADVERNLRIPLAGIARVAESRGDLFHSPAIAVRTGDTPQSERARFRREPADILITTPESLYLILTSNAREAVRSIEVVIVDEIHTLVPTKRGAHLALSLERLETRCARPLQRIGLSATQRPLDEVARFLGGTTADHDGTKWALAESEWARTDGNETPDDAEHQIEDEFTAPGVLRRDRPVTIVDAGIKKSLALTIDVPVDDLAKLATAADQQGNQRGSRSSAAVLKKSRDGVAGADRPSIWSAIHPRLLELIRQHRSTLIFVNNRRLAERLAGALNELAGEALVRSHHGSIAKAQRLEIEELLKAGELRALVATSSLELGVDMGSIDLVVQIEAPPSVASGLQRIGRGGHRANATSEGVIFPKFRGDLVACAAVARAMHDGNVEATRFPRNPLDILAQQVVAAVSMDEWTVDDLFAMVRRAAPFADLSRGAFEGVLDMLSGRYPSDEFAELRPRVTWDRVLGRLTAREGAKRVAIANGGTIPDRGLYGVFLLGASRSTPGGARVGELDEEMVFESRVGETFVLGASSWRIEEITHDRVLVSPAPGQPGKMPFWKGDRAGRPLELGLAIGRLIRTLLRLPPEEAIARLKAEHDLDERAAQNLLRYLHDQLTAAGVVPDDRAVVIERVRDELGDWRVCVLSPRGGRIHAPWAMAAAAKIREETGFDVETLWGDDGFVVRYPDVDRPPEPRLFLPDPDEVQALAIRQLGATALFAGKFRENAARSLLLPKRRPGMRAPLWQQRKRAADLLAVASRFGSFPVLLETYRECLRDFFDMPALISTLRDIRSRKLSVATVDSDVPSPFAGSLLFSYVSSFIYDGDAPLAERRAQALAVDQAQLRELLGDAELRELLDADAIATIERELQRLDPRYHARSADGVHDMLLALGDLSEHEIAARSTATIGAASMPQLVASLRVLTIRIGGEPRYIAVEDAARVRDALVVGLPAGVPESLLQPVRDPLGDIALRYARTHGPFPASDLAGRYGLELSAAEAVLLRLTGEGRLIEGEFRPGGTGREWTDSGVLRMIRRRSLARLRHEIEPVSAQVLGRFSTNWHGVVTPRQGADALLATIEQLQGAPLPASILETEILPARINDYDPVDLDAAIASGEVAWVGCEPLGDHDGRIALYLADHLPKLLAPRTRLEVQSGTPRETSSGKEIESSPKGPGEADTREAATLDYLASHGASFFSPVHDAVGGGYPAETVRALWNLVWKGLVTNDTFHALRAYTQVAAGGRKARRRRIAGRGAGLSGREIVPGRSRRLAPPSAEGRWSLVESGAEGSTTAWATGLTTQLMTRHGVLTREAVMAESIPGGFGLVYPVLKGMEEHGRIRRGYFVAGLGATQFALPGALDLLRSLRDPGDPSSASSNERAAHRDPSPDDGVEVAVLAATDPANPFGATLRWPPVRAHKSAEGADTGTEAGRGPTRTVGATVIIVNGALSAYLARGDRQLLTFLPDAEPDLSKAGRAIAQALIHRARSGDESPRGMLIEDVDGSPPSESPLSRLLIEAGFIPGALGYQANLRSDEGPRTMR